MEANNTGETDMTMQYKDMTIADLANVIPVNDVDQEKVAAIAADIIANGWDDDAPCVVVCGDHAITGSHRIAAARLAAQAGRGEDGIYVIDATDAVNTYCADNDTTVDYIDYSDLRAIFGGFEGAIIEDIKRNIEW